jgi:hypothetical protein
MKRRNSFVALNHKFGFSCQTKKVSRKKIVRMCTLITVHTLHQKIKKIVVKFFDLQILMIS